jgi:anion-transporting  ArsA/GET3 family ATPase
LKVFAAHLRRPGIVRKLLKPRSVIVVLGSGGVGKTTIAAALGVAAAAADLRTAIITVDPARRLREALGMPRLGAKPTRIDARRLRAAGLDPSLKLSAMMLDVKGAWDSMIAEMIADPAVRRRILDNTFYRRLSSEFAGSDAYAALEALYDLDSSGEFDLVVVDTPPAAHAFEFVQAPSRLIRLLDSQAARWLFRPARAPFSIALKMAGRIAAYVARELERFAGGDALSSIAGFFAAASEAGDRIAARMRKVAALLRSPTVRFIVVTSSEPDRLAEARKLIEQMEAEKLHLAAIIINRFLDEALWRSASEPSARASRKLSPARRDRALGAALEDIPALKAMLHANGSADPETAAVLEYLESYRKRAADDMRRVNHFIASISPRVEIALAPEMDSEKSALAAVARLARFVFDSQPTPAARAHLAKAAVSQRQNASRRNAERTSDRAADRMPE